MYRDERAAYALSAVDRLLDLLVRYQRDLRVVLNGEPQRFREVRPCWFRVLISVLYHLVLREKCVAILFILELFVKYQYAVL